MNSKQFAIIASITFFVGMIWLIADIAFNTKASIPVSPKQQTLLEPISPTFNDRVLEVIDKETLDRGEISISDAPLPSPSAQTGTAPAIEPGPAGEGTSEGAIN